MRASLDNDGLGRLHFADAPYSETAGGPAQPHTWFYDDAGVPQQDRLTSVRK